jgi:hypothetical protein
LILFLYGHRNGCNQLSNPIHLTCSTRSVAMLSYFVFLAIGTRHPWLWVPLSTCKLVVKNSSVYESLPYCVSLFKFGKKKERLRVESIGLE